MKKSKLKRYIIRKYIKAKSLSEALKKEPEALVDDAWIDDEWKKENPNILESAIGFEADEGDQASGCEANK